MTHKRSSNYVLYAKSNEFFWEGYGQLSIKTFSNGKAHYKTDKGFFAVEEDRYLLLNEGPYTISIEEERDVESFCIFFKNGLAENVLRTLTDSQDSLLTDPFRETDDVSFFEKTNHKSHRLSSQMRAFKTKSAELAHDGQACYEEHFHQLMVTLLFDHVNTLKEVESLNAVRCSTRNELYRRVSVAHDYIRAFYDRQIKLADIAHVSCLSENHLLRTYSQLYGRTPHRHMSEYRVEKAKRLLADQKFSITDITFEVGFNNPVSFSKMFKQFTGASPLQFRKKVILDKTC